MRREHLAALAIPFIAALALGAVRTQAPAYVDITWMSVTKM